jgi:hypothetical protein
VGGDLFETLANVRSEVMLCKILGTILGKGRRVEVTLEVFKGESKVQDVNVGDGCTSLGGEGIPELGDRGGDEGREDDRVFHDEDGEWSDVQENVGVKRMWLGARVGTRFVFKRLALYTLCDQTC